MKSYTIAEIKKCPCMMMEKKFREKFDGSVVVISAAVLRNNLRHQLLEELKIKEKKDETKKSSL